MGLYVQLVPYYCFITMLNIYLTLASIADDQSFRIIKNLIDY